MRKAAWNSWTHCEPEKLPASGVRFFYESENLKAPDKGRGDREATRMEQAFQRSMAQMLEQALDLSETRMERVARIRAAINEGTYLPDIAELAQKLMETMCGEFR
jgi:flagellar biosynthesis anti-sigma factor FlgM